MKSLRAQLILSHVLPLLILLPLLGLLLWYIVETQVVLANFTDELTREAASLAQIASAEQRIFTDQGQGLFFVRAASAHYNRNVALVEADGDEFAALADPNTLPSQEPNTEELTALNEGKIETRADFNVNAALVNVQALAPVLDAQQRLVGIVRVTEHVDRVYARLTQMRVLILGVTLAALVVAVGIGTLLATRTARRLDSVTNAITQVAHGGTMAIAAGDMPTEFQAAFAAVNDLQSRLQESEDTRKRLLANLVHELGRPLGALQAAIHALQRGADSDPVLRQELLEGMDAQVERLKPLLDNLASLHGGLSGAIVLQKTPVDLNEWLPKIIVTWREAAEQKGLKWEQDITSNLPVVNMDPNRMAQALGNLLSNAVKYTPEGGTVSVGAAADAQNVRLVVRDTGMGISPDEQARIFDPLYRGNPAQTVATNRFPQGMGLGLSIARDVAVAHGGSITVESAVGQGSTFTIRLPQASAA